MDNSSIKALIARIEATVKRQELALAASKAQLEAAQSLLTPATVAKK